MTSPSTTRPVPSSPRPAGPAGPAGGVDHEEQALAVARSEPDGASPDSDAEVIARSLDDPPAFAEIFDRHHEAVHRFLWSRVGGDVADDAAAEVFRIALERRHTYDRTYASAKPWLFGIAARVAKQRHRQAARRDDLRSRLRRQPDANTDHGPEQRLHELALESPVASALLELPEGDRDALLLYAWDELSYEEIARTLDVPVGTVRSRIHRARRTVRAQLAETAPETAARRGDDHD